MYVCVCNAITEREITGAVARGWASYRQLREELGVGTCCGRCAGCAREVLRKALADTEAVRVEVARPRAKAGVPLAA